MDAAENERRGRRARRRRSMHCFLRAKRDARRLAEIGEPVTIEWLADTYYGPLEQYERDMLVRELEALGWRNRLHDEGAWLLPPVTASPDERGG